MTKAPGQADETDFPGDSEERAKAADASIGALCNPEDIIADYGDFEGDHGKNDNAKSWEHTDVDTPYFDRAAIYSPKEDED
jgi:hypothetical protein